MAGPLLAAVATAAYARRIAPYRPRLERISIAAPAGHRALAGLRIGFVTDSHVGPFFTSTDLARATALVAKEAPDLVLFGGDCISESPRYIAPAVAVLETLASKAPLGAIAVLGNHDYSVSGRRVAAALTGAGIHLLHNSARSVAYGGDELWIAGIDDMMLGDPQPERAFAGIPSGAAAIVLWHEPVRAEEAAALGAFLQLSGHTHGGQIRLPWIGALGLPEGGRRHVIGLHDAAGMPVYTSRGAGAYRPPVRFNCPPEVTIITLA